MEIIFNSDLLIKLTQKLIYNYVIPNLPTIIFIIEMAVIVFTIAFLMALILDYSQPGYNQALSDEGKLKSFAIWFTSLSIFYHLIIFLILVFCYLYESEIFIIRF